MKIKLSSTTKCEDPKCKDNHCPKKQIHVEIKTSLRSLESFVESYKSSREKLGEKGASIVYTFMVRDEIHLPHVHANPYALVTIGEENDHQEDNIHWGE